MTKRQKFLLSAMVLSLGLLSIQWVSLEYRFVAVFGLTLSTYLISAFALLDDLKGVEWLTILILPTFYTAAIALFYFLLPEGIVSRLAILSLFGLGLYAVYLTENIFSVASVRTIQLVRAAHAVGFLILLLTMALLFNTIFSMRWVFWINGIAVFAVSFPLILQAIWAVKLEDRISKEVLVSSFGISLILGQAAVALSFLPVTLWVGSLFLATIVYVCMGLLQHAMQERLFMQTIYEYVGVGLFVLLATLYVTPWR